MASTTAICTSFKQELLEALHDFNTGAHAFNWALYTSTATHGAATTAYSATNEVAGTGYTAKGATNANIDPVTSGTKALLDWLDVTWSSATITAASVLLFNDTHASDASVAVWDFGGDQVASGGDFVLEMPTPDASNAILRLA